MYDLIRRQVALADVRRDGEVAQAKLEVLVEYTEELMVHTTNFDLTFQMLGSMASPLGQRLLAQEVMGFAMHGMSIGRGQFRAR